MVKSIVIIGLTILQKSTTSSDLEAFLATTEAFLAMRTWKTGDLKVMVIMKNGYSP